MPLVSGQVISRVAVFFIVKMYSPANLMPANPILGDADSLKIFFNLIILKEAIIPDALSA